MDINNNQLIHTFGKGMNSDTSDMYLSNELYRYAENLRYSTNKNSNSGELRLIEGTSPIELPVNKWDEIIAMTSIRDYLIVVGAKGNTFNIYRKNLGEKQDNWKALLNIDLPLESRNINLLGRWESDKNIKLYMVDGIHPLMCLRINDFNEAVKIDNIDDLSTQVNYLLPPLKVSISKKAGLLKPAKVQYAYTLSDDSGMETSLSVLSNVVSLYNGNKGYGIKETIITDSAIDINITYTKELANLTNIRLYRITCRLGGQSPLIELFYDGKRHDNSNTNGDTTETFIDTGSVVIKTLSTEEFLAITKLGIIPQEIEAKDGYLFLGNVKYTQDQVDEKVRNIDCSEYFDIEFEFNDQWVAFDNTISEEHDTDAENPDRKSLRRGETYRYGVILYDEHGRASSPKFIKDVVVPEADGSDENFEIVQGFRREYTNNTATYKLRSVGINVTQKKEFPASSGVTGWLIIRVKRTLADRKTITLGIIGSPMFVTEALLKYKVYNGELFTTKVIKSEKEELQDTFSDYPTALLSMLMQFLPVAKLENGATPDEQVAGYALKDQNTAIFMSPESCYTLDDLENILPEAELLKVKNVMMYEIPMYTITGNNYVSEEYISTGNRYVPEGYISTKVDQYLSYVYTNPQWYHQYEYFKISTEDTYKSFYNLWELLKTIYNLLDTEFLYEFNTGTSQDYGEIIKHGMDVPHITIHEDAEDGNEGLFREVAFSLNHLYPLWKHILKETSSTCIYPNDNVAISNISFAESPEFNKFAESTGSDLENINITYKDNVYFAGIRSFINWTAWGFALTSEADIKDRLRSKTEKAMHHNIGTGPKCMLISAKDKLGFGYYLNKDHSLDRIFPISIVNILRTNSNPYGGYSDPNITKDVFLERDSVIINAHNGASKTIFDGDCFVGMFTANVAHIWKDSMLWDAARISTIYTVPIESDINLKATCGDLYPRMIQDERFHQLDKTAVIKYPKFTYIQQNDAYLYNTAYSKEEDLIGLSTIEYKTTDSNNHDCRIHYSQPKVNGQDPDPWPIFKPMNFIDVDDRYGCITGLKLFKDRLVFWLENATGLLTVNEKAITQAVNGSDIILGTSDVMQRYDYVSTIYGMYKNQHAFAESNQALYWWDSYNKEMLLYSGLLVPMSKKYGIENYINTTTESTKPHIAYDCDYDEIISNIRNNQAIVFSERLDCFTSVYTFDPRFSAIIDGKLYLANSSNIYKMDSLMYKDKSVLFDEKAYPLLKYVVNANSSYPKVFDIQTMGGNFYSGDLSYEEPIFANDNHKLKPLQFKYKTPLNLNSWVNGLNMSNREYDFRLNIPRDKVKPKENARQINEFYGDRMRGKTMQCELSSTSNSTDFSLQYIITKYRISWS